MKKAGIFFMLICLHLSLPAQYSIQVKVDSMPIKKAYLFEYVGINRNMADSAKASPDGSFVFNLPADAHPGMYRIVVGPSQYWDIIFNREPIRMRTHFSAVLDSLKIIELLGVFTKPLVLCIRLFANILAGHFIALSFIVMIFIFGQISWIAGYGSSVVAILFYIFMTMLELLVSFIQAYVFTLLSALYIGMAMEEEHAH